MNISVERTGTTSTIAIDDRLDTLTAPELQRVVSAEASACEQLVVDATNLDYISSAGLRALVMAHKLMAKKGGFVLHNPKNNVREIVELTGLGKFLTID